jgi:hypothetical protein
MENTMTFREKRGAELDTNPTQIIGVTTNALAAALCGLTTFRCKGTVRRYWLTLLVLFTLLSIEVALGLRYGLHDFFAGMLRQTDRYADRRDLQIFVLLAAIATSIALALAMRSQIRPAVSATRGAALAGALSLALILTESISLHSIDAVFWLPVGGIKVIGWLWAVLALAATLAALRTILALQAPTKQADRVDLKF